MSSFFFSFGLKPQRENSCKLIKWWGKECFLVKVMGKWLNERWKWSEEPINHKLSRRQRVAFCWVGVNLTLYIADKNIFPRLLIPLDLDLGFQVSINLLLKEGFFPSYRAHQNITYKRTLATVTTQWSPLLGALLLQHISHFIKFMPVLP